MTIHQLAEKTLLQVKMEASKDHLIEQLAQYPMDQLDETLRSDEQKNAFWINIYNAFFLILRKEHQLDKPEIYRNKVIRIAGQALSLDDIEHGILRKYRYKFSLGYFPNPFTPSIIKKLAVSKIDYRIHFALNCGAKSCPPIAFYQYEKLNTQLDMATQSYLESDTLVFPEKKELHITRLFLWFKGDFGGGSGIRKLLGQVLQLKTTGFKLVYKEYDWEEDLSNFA